MKTNTLEVFAILKRLSGMDEASAEKVVKYIEDANEAEIVRAVERRIEHLATKEDLANLRAEMKSDFSSTIKWMFIFQVTQLAAMFGFLFYFLHK